VSSREKILFSLAILLMFSMLLFILFGDSGLADLRLLKMERDRLIEKNDKRAQDNLLLYREIDRLKNDLQYIENVARQELGMVGKDEVVVKINDSSGKSK